MDIRATIRHHAELAQRALAKLDLQGRMPRGGDAELRKFLNEVVAVSKEIESEEDGLSPQEGLKRLLLLPGLKEKLFESGGPPEYQEGRDIARGLLDLKAHVDRPATFFKSDLHPALTTVHPKKTLQKKGPKKGK